MHILAVEIYWFIYFKMFPLLVHKSVFIVESFYMIFIRKNSVSFHRSGQLKINPTFFLESGRVGPKRDIDTPYLKVC